MPEKYLKNYLTSSRDFEGLFWHEKCGKLNSILTVKKKV
jgi:hypothetical protein